MEFAIIIPVVLIAFAPVTIVGCLILWKLYEVYKWWCFIRWKHRYDSGEWFDSNAATMYAARFGYYPHSRYWIIKENKERCDRWEIRLYGEATLTTSVSV